MLVEPGERSTDTDLERERLAGVLSRPNQTLIVAETDDQLVGYVAVLGGHYRRNRHSAHIVIGVLAAFAGEGIGGSLLDEASSWSKGVGIHRLELTVMAHNDRAIRLYERKGFVREGTRRHALLVNGAWVDELHMAKLLPAS